MRNFYKDIITNLYIYCGNRQAEKMTDDELKTLLDGLCRLSKVYEYIPEQSQQEIILTCLITDKEYQNINVRLVSKWFEQNGKKYFKEAAHKEIETPEDYKPLEGEERDKMIAEYLEAISKATTNFAQAHIKGSGSKLKENLEQNNIIEPEDVKQERLKAIELKKRYKEENYLPGGNCKESWLPYDEWLKKQGAIN